LLRSFGGRVENIEPDVEAVSEGRDDDFVFGTVAQEEVVWI